MAQSRNLLIVWRMRPTPCASYQWISARRSSPPAMRLVAIPLSYAYDPTVPSPQLRELANCFPDGDCLDVGDRSDDLEVHVASSLDRRRRTPGASAAKAGTPPSGARARPPGRRSR